MSACFRRYTPGDVDPSKFKDGDLVFFRWRPTLACTSVTLATLSKYTHVGLVISYADQYGIMALHLLESQRHYADGLRDALTFQIVQTGVRLSRLVQRLEASKSPFYVRRSDAETSRLAQRKGADFARKYAGRPYEKSLLTMANSAWHLKKPKKDMSSVFCSELVAQFLIKIRQLDRNIASAYYSPGQLAAIPLQRYGRVERC